MDGHKMGQNCFFECVSYSPSVIWRGGMAADLPAGAIKEMLQGAVENLVIGMGRATKTDELKARYIHYVVKHQQISRQGKSMISAYQQNIQNNRSILMISTKI